VVIPLLILVDDVRLLSMLVHVPVCGLGFPTIDLSDADFLG
jgi:hypothetical protein